MKFNAEVISYPLESTEEFRVVKSQKIDKHIRDALIDLHRKKYSKRAYFMPTNKCAYLVGTTGEQEQLYVYTHDDIQMLLQIEWPFPKGE